MRDFATFGPNLGDDVKFSEKKRYITFLSRIISKQKMFRSARSRIDEDMESGRRMACKGNDCEAEKKGNCWRRKGNLCGVDSVVFDVPKPHRGHYSEIVCPKLCQFRVLNWNVEKNA